jgi:hypothetical protein
MPPKAAEKPLPPLVLESAPLNPAMQAVFAEAAKRSPAVARLLGPVAEEENSLVERALKAAADFARQMLAEFTPPEVRAWMHMTGWQIRPDVDRRLLRYVDESLDGQLIARPELKVLVRNAFWEEFRTKAPPFSGDTGT